MKIIIAGPRNFTDYDKLCNIIDWALLSFEIHKPTEIVSGRARGVDKMGEKWAKAHNIKIAPFPAKWKDLDVPNVRKKMGPYGWYNANAGFDRNEKMAQYADALIAIDLNTPGTAHMIKLGKQYGLRMFIYKPQDEE